MTTTSDNLTLQTPRLLLRILDSKAGAAVADYYSRNRSFHQPWFALRGDGVFTARQQQANLTVEYQEFINNRALPFWLSLRDDPKRIIGRFAFTNIVHGCFDSCFAAYHLDQACQGLGLGLEAGQAVLRVAFEDFGLHRIEANIMPANQRSLGLAERLGFRLEGLSPQYLKINGNWEDHLHYVRLADSPADAQPQPLPTLDAGQLIARPLVPADIPAAIDYYQRNRDHLYAWNPAPALDLTSEAGWHTLFATNRREQSAGSRVDLGLFFPDRPQWLAGTIECRSIQPLPWSSCELGFSIDRLLAGRGLMAEALSATIAWLFARYGLKRILANCAPEHERSLQLLEMLGFAREGVARQAVWRDENWHDLAQLALLREDFRVV